MKIKVVAAASEVNGNRRRVSESMLHLCFLKMKIKAVVTNRHRRERREKEKKEEKNAKKSKMEKNIIKLFLHR